MFACIATVVPKAPRTTVSALALTDVISMISEPILMCSFAANTLPDDTYNVVAPKVRAALSVVGTGATAVVCPLHCKYVARAAVFAKAGWVWRTLFLTNSILELNEFELKL